MDRSLLSVTAEEREDARAEDEQVGMRLGQEALQRLERRSRPEELASASGMRMEMEFDAQRRREGVVHAEYTAVDTSQFRNVEIGRGYRHSKVVRQSDGKGEQEASKVVDMRYGSKKKDKKSALEVVKANMKVQKQQKTLLTTAAVQAKHQGPMKTLRLALQKRLEAKLRAQRKAR